MDGAETVKTDHAVEFGEDFVQMIRNVVATIPDMAGIQADAHKDRHARIGEGCIGQEALIRVVQHPALKDLPFYLETPNELDGYAKEIALMREQAE